MYRSTAELVQSENMARIGGGLKGPEPKKKLHCPHGTNAGIVTRRRYPKWWDEQIGWLSKISFRQCLSRITLSDWGMAVMLHSTMGANTQWYFPLSALVSTPSASPRPRELYDRARGIEFLFRLGSSLALSVLQFQPSSSDAFLRPTSAMCTAATWFHRFYMRYSMNDFHRQVYRSSLLKISSSPSWKDVAATCIFLATKTEECGRKLKDVARICQAKVHSTDVNNIPADGKVRWAVTIAWLSWIGSFF